MYYTKIILNKYGNTIYTISIECFHIKNYIIWKFINVYLKEQLKIVMYYYKPNNIQIITLIVIFVFITFKNNLLILSLSYNNLWYCNVKMF